MAETKTAHTEDDQRSSAWVYMDDQDGIEQPETFRFCPLGIQIYTSRPFRDCDLLDFKINIPDGNQGEQEIACTGIVAQCVTIEDNVKYRVWIKFLDLPGQAGDQIREASCKRSYLCPDCANYEIQ